MKLQLLLVTLALVFVFPSISAQDTVRQVSGGVVNGRAINLPAPEYPAAAKALGASGAVNVEVLIDENGNVVSASAVSGHPLLKSNSETAALQARFIPSLRSGEPVKVSGIIVYNFQLPVQPEDSVVSDDIELIGFTAALRVMTRVNSDPRLKSVANTFFDAFGEEFDGSGMPKEFASLTELPKADSERRSEILADLNSKFSDYVPNEKAWQVAVGEASGDLLAESLSWSATGSSDANAYKVSLLKLKELMNSAPDDFPRDLLSKYNDVIEFSTDMNLEDNEVVRSLNAKIDIIGDLILM